MPFFIVRQMQEKFRAKEKKLYFGIVDLEKAFDGALRVLPVCHCHIGPVLLLPLPPLATSYS